MLELGELLKDHLAQHTLSYYQASFYNKKQTSEDPFEKQVEEMFALLKEKLGEITPPVEKDSKATITISGIDLLSRLMHLATSASSSKNVVSLCWSIDNLLYNQLEQLEHQEWEGRKADRQVAAAAAANQLRLRQKKKAVNGSISSSSYDNQSLVPHVTSLSSEDQSSLQSMLQASSDWLLSEYTQTITHLTQTESSIQEISRLQNTLHFHLSTQTAQLDRLYDDAQSMLGNVRRGNQELQKAKREGKKGFREGVVLMIITLALLLLLIHHISA